LSAQPEVASSTAVTARTIIRVVIAS